MNNKSEVMWMSSDTIQFKLLFQLSCGWNKIYIYNYGVYNRVLAEISSWHLTNAKREFYPYVMFNIIFV
jgi:hypothetical protein